VKNLSITVPRRHGWYIILVVLEETLWAYLHRVRSITFEVGE